MSVLFDDLLLFGDDDVLFDCGCLVGEFDVGFVFFLLVLV